MNTTQLECFVKVAETLNFLKASKELNISQPAVSKQIVSLENELNAKLLLRTTHSVTLTKTGEAFLNEAKNILRLIYHSKQVAMACNKDNDYTLKIGYTETHELENIRNALKEMKVTYPRFTPIFSIDSWDANITNLERGQLDLCFAFENFYREGKSLNFEPLTTDKLVCILPKEHPMATSNEVCFKKLKNYPQIICVPPALKNKYHSGVMEPDIPYASTQEIYICSNAAEAYTMVLSGFGYCLLPEYIVLPNENLQFLAWPETTKIKHGVIYSLSNTKYRLISDFIGVLKNG